MQVLGPHSGLPHCQPQELLRQQEAALLSFSSQVLCRLGSCLSSRSPVDFSGSPQAPLTPVLLHGVPEGVAVEYFRAHTTPPGRSERFWLLGSVALVLL